MLYPARPVGRCLKSGNGSFNNSSRPSRETSSEFVCECHLSPRSRQFQLRLRLRRLVVQLDNGFHLRMHGRISDLPDEFAGGPVEDIRLVGGFPFLKPLFPLLIQPGPAFRFAVDTATPWLGRQPGAKTFLADTKFLIKRISS